MIIKYVVLISVIMLNESLLAQTFTGEDLLNKAIEYHDPNGEWSSFHGTLSVTMTTPDAKERISTIVFDLPREYFKLTSVREGTTLDMTLKKDSCALALNGNRSFSEQAAKKNRLSCGRARMMKNYYTYLYGLPMKLKDPGTIIDSKVRRKTFKGKEYLVLKATYEKEVGRDIWYFYFDPESYAMQVYQFFHDEAKNDGEYILLSGIQEVSQMKIPKIRAWHYNKDNGYLGTDSLTSGGLLVDD